MGFLETHTNNATQNATSSIDRENNTQLFGDQTKFGGFSLGTNTHQTPSPHPFNTSINSQQDHGVLSSISDGLIALNLNDKDNQSTQSVSIPTSVFPRFKVIKDTSSTNILLFQSITKMGEYADKSFEEWRWLFSLALQGKLNENPFENYTRNSIQSIFPFNAPKTTFLPFDTIKEPTPTTPSFGEQPQIDAGLISVYKGSTLYNNISDFSDLLIEIYDDNGLFDTINTCRLLLGESRVLSNMLKTSCKMKKDKYTLEVRTSELEGRLGKIKGSVLYLAIYSIVGNVNVHIDDFIQVLLVLDYFQISSISRFTNTLAKVMELSEYIACSFMEKFNLLRSDHQCIRLYDLFSRAFRVVVDGKDLRSQTVYKGLNRELFVNEIRNLRNIDLTKLLKVIDYWVSYNLNLPSEETSQQIMNLLGVIPIHNSITMIKILSSDPSPYHFVNLLSTEWKLKFINTYISNIS